MTWLNLKRLMSESALCESLTGKAAGAQE